MRCVRGLPQRRAAAGASPSWEGRGRSKGVIDKERSEGDPPAVMIARSNDQKQMRVHSSGTAFRKQDAERG